MQSDLQSVENVLFFSTLRIMSFCPKNVGNWSSSPQDESEFSPKIYPELFPASPGAQLQEITDSTFSIQLGQIRLQPPIGDLVEVITAVYETNITINSRVGYRNSTSFGTITAEKVDKR